MPKLKKTLYTTAQIKVGGAPPRPEFIGLPKPGTPCPYTSLGRSSLNILVLPCKENGYKPLVKSINLRRPGTAKGRRLIHLASLLEYLHSLPADLGSDEE